MRRVGGENSLLCFPGGLTVVDVSFVSLVQSAQLDMKTSRRWVKNITFTQSAKNDGEYSNVGKKQNLHQRPPQKNTKNTHVN